MKKKRKIAYLILFLVTFLYINFSTNINAEQMSERLLERMKENENQINPLDEQKLRSTTPAEGFKYFSGYSNPLNAHPTIYAGSTKIFVVGYKYYKEFSINQLWEAFNAFRELLILDCYLNKGK